MKASSLLPRSLKKQSVAEQIDEFIYVKNPSNCVGGIRVIIRASLLVRRLLSSLRNT
jgi:hypothetical protein